MSLTVTIVLGSKTFLFDSAVGIDTGDYVDPKGEFVQGNRIVFRMDTPVTVEFRTDKSSARVEIVFNNFKAWGMTNAAAAHLGPYRAVIADGPTAIATIEVPCHYWGSRWRWNPTPRPVRSTPPELIANKLMPPYGDTLATSINWDSAVYARPMDSAGIYVSMPTTGERPDIGPVTEWCAHYMLDPSEQALAGILAQAEACGSMPLHLRDETTHAPIDFDRYPGANWYAEAGYNGAPWIKTGPAPPWTKDPDQPWELDYAHFPDNVFLPFLLTGDPYFLEELQYQLTWKMGWTNLRDANNKRLIPENQTRGYAWTLRNLFQVVRVTPDSVPSWFNSKDYWRSILTACLSRFTSQYVNNSNPAGTIFHAALFFGGGHTWEEDFLATMLGWGNLMGFSEWRQAYEWKLGNTLARTNGTSGWARQACSPYELCYGPARPFSPAAGTGFVWYDSWAAAWADHARDDKTGIQPLPWPDSQSFMQTYGNDYLLYTRGALILAAASGVTLAQEPAAFVDNMVMTRPDKYMTARWSIAAAPAISNR